MLSFRYLCATNSAGRMPNHIKERIASLRNLIKGGLHQENLDQIVAEAAFLSQPSTSATIRANGTKGLNRKLARRPHFRVSSAQDCPRGGIGRRARFRF